MLPCGVWEKAAAEAKERDFFQNTRSQEKRTEGRASEAAFAVTVVQNSQANQIVAPKSTVIVLCDVLDFSLQILR